MRSIGLDVHRDFCEVAIAEQGRVRSAGRIGADRESLSLFAESLSPTDEVALEVTGQALEIARVLAPHVARVQIANTKQLKAISHAKLKSDTVDARTIAKLLASGFLPAIWTPDEQTRSRRRRVARRAALVRQRTRAKNEVHAVLMRNLERPPVSDLFGKRGRAWLGELDLPADERESVDGLLRVIDFLAEEIDQIERALAKEALADADFGRLMSVPGVSLVTAATFLAQVGDISRFPTPAKLVGYLGLDPRVRQSGATPARHGRISKEGSARVRTVLVEAAWTAAREPGPLRAFYARLKARRGHSVAIVALARKLCVIFWHLLAKGEDYAYGRASLTQRKRRRVELLAGAASRRGKGGGGPAHASSEQAAAERALGLQAEAAYRRLVADWQRQQKGAGAASEARISRPSERHAARQAKASAPAL